MKNIIFLFLFQIIYISVNAQKALSFEKVNKADSISKEQLFVSIYDWFATTYNDSKEVIQMSDKEQGLIVGKGNVKYLPLPNQLMYKCYHGYINYNIKAYIKDNRYKVVVDQFNHQGTYESAGQCDLGIITDSELFTKTGWAAKQKNQIWKHLQVFVEGYSIMLFDLLEKKTNEINVELASDDW